MAHEAASGGGFLRDHTLFLALLVVVNICLDLIALRPEGVAGVPIFWGGILTAQTFLMGDPDLIALADAWPTLPDAIRNQIVALASVASVWPNLPEFMPANSPAPA